MIEYIEGNILDTDCDIICHQVNCQGVMGSGLAKQIKEKYPEVFKKYIDYYNEYQFKQLLLGKCLISKCNDGKYIANMFAQLFYGTNKVQTDYKALDDCINNVSITARMCNKSIAIPYKLGCGLAGGDWNIVKELIEFYFINTETICKIYKYDKNQF